MRRWRFLTLEFRISQSTTHKTSFLWVPSLSGRAQLGISLRISNSQMPPTLCLRGKKKRVNRWSWTLKIGFSKIIMMQPWSTPMLLKPPMAKDQILFPNLWWKISINILKANYQKIWVKIWIQACLPLIVTTNKKLLCQLAITVHNAKLSSLPSTP